MTHLVASGAAGMNLPGVPQLREEEGLLFFTNGIVELSVDAATGAWLAFARPGEPPALGRGSPSAGWVSIRTPEGWMLLDGEASHCVGYRVETGTSETFLFVARRQGVWEICERYGLRPGCDLLSRSVAFTLCEGTPVEVDAVRLSLRGVCVDEPAGCRFLVPERFPPEIVPYASLKPERVTGISGQADLLVVVHHEGARRGMAVASLCRTDVTYGSVVEHEETIEIHHEFLATQEARPGQTFTLGTQYVRLVEGDLDATLVAAQRIFALAGHGLPADVPADAPDCVIYSAHAGGTVDSGLRDGSGGFQGYAARIPYLAELGFNTFWMLPFWHGSFYAPIAYDRLDARLGDEADLKALVDTAHRHGARLLADLIPHGPKPESGLEQSHPEWIARDRDGNFRYRWGCYDCDYAHPGWQQFMAEHAVDWVRRAGLDGYRVDVALGQGENWRPHDGNRPGNSRVGGIVLLEKVRQALHQEKASCLLLAEATHPGLWSSCELMYDFPFAYQVAPCAVTMPAAEFVPALRRWLQWQRALLPDGALLMRYVESHDTARARLLYGPGLTRAFLGLLCTIHGVPMIYDEGEVGFEPFLRALLAARKAHPALTRGEADYLAVETSAPEVCGILRALPDAAAIVAINFSSRPVVARLAIEESRLPGKVATGPWHDALGAQVKVRRTGTRLCLRVPLAPYGTAVVVPGAPSPIPTPVASPSRAAESSEGRIEHRNPHYRLLIDRSTGLLQALEAADGTTLLSAMAIRTDPRDLQGGGDRVEWQARPQPRFRERSRGCKRVLEFSGTVSRGPEDETPILHYTLAYTLDATPKVAVELRLMAVEAIEEVPALVQTLRLPAGGWWFVETLEGEMCGETVARHTEEEPRFTARYRHSQPWALWEERLLPLAGRFGARIPGGPGVALGGVGASMPGWRQNLVLRAPALGEEGVGCQAELRWGDGCEALSLRAGQCISLRFDAVLLPAGEGAPPARPRARVPILIVEGPRYTVENAHYRATLVRSRGGGLVELRAPGGASLLRDSAIYSDRGLYGDETDPDGHRVPIAATTQGDTEPEMVIEREEGQLIITVDSTLHRPDGGDGAVLRPITRARLCYTFDDGPEIGVTLSLLPPGVTAEPVFLAQRMQLAGVQYWYAGDQFFPASEQGADRVWQSRVTPLSAGACLHFVGDGALTVTDIELCEEFANLFVLDEGGGHVSLFIAPYDGTPITIRRWITFGYRLKAE
ncbi:MAG: hypothetical protein GX785_05120 [Armatimonadetes bacterium]|nr:hypothetical protein [Armatimonadota bacterium]